MVSLERYLNRITERVYENRKDISQKNKQRRTVAVDLYGIEYTRQGDGDTPARFYISVSPDLIYYERFQFKLNIQPFVSNVKTNGMSRVAVKVNEKSLSINNNQITPNPHDHTTEEHTHTLISGISLTSTTADDFEVWIEGIDITDYLIQQQGGDWIDGEGIYPSKSIDPAVGFYDILAVASVMMAEGRDADVQKMLKPGYKKLEIKSNAPFQVTLINYLKFNHINR